MVKWPKVPLQLKRVLLLKILLMTMKYQKLISGQSIWGVEIIFPWLYFVGALAWHPPRFGGFVGSLPWPKAPYWYPPQVGMAVLAARGRVHDHLLKRLVLPKLSITLMSHNENSCIKKVKNSFKTKEWMKAFLKKNFEGPEEKVQCPLPPENQPQLNFTSVAKNLEGVLKTDSKLSRVCLSP